MLDNTIVQHLLDTYVKAIHEQDTDLFQSIWAGTQEDTLIAVTTIFHGPKAIQQDFLMGAIRKTFTLIDLFIDKEPIIHALGPDDAIIIFPYHTECTKRETGEAFSIQGWETQVLKKIDGVWKIFHDHYSMSAN